MRLLDTLRGGGGLPAARSLGSLEEYAQALSWFGHGGVDYQLSGQQGPVQLSMPGRQAEPISSDFRGFAEVQRTNGVIFACMLVRMTVFSAVRFQYQLFNQGRPSELWGDPSLRLLEQPWSGGTTQGLLSRAIQDADLAGNSYWTVVDGGSGLARLRPDWVMIVTGDRVVPSAQFDDEGRRGLGVLGQELVGYLYTEGGWQSGSEPVWLWPEQVTHFAPLPDPLFTYRGMSWLTPLIREIQSDQVMTHHKQRFFENAATPNLVITYPKEVRREQIEWVSEIFRQQHEGIGNAFKTLHLGGGADVTVAGADLKQVEFKVTQGHGETRIAACANVPPIIVGLSEGLESATYSNYSQARRRFADGTLHPLWSDVAGSFQRIMRVRPGSRLWYDSRDVPFLREDSGDAATILETQARTIRTLVDGGYEPESAKRAVLSGDLGLLVHTGLFSVQLQTAGAQQQVTEEVVP